MRDDCTCKTHSNRPSSWLWWLKKLQLVHATHPFLSLYSAVLFFLDMLQISIKGTYCQSSFSATFVLYCNAVLCPKCRIGSIHSGAFPSSRMELKKKKEGGAGPTRTQLIPGLTILQFCRTREPLSSKRVQELSFKMEHRSGPMQWNRPELSASLFCNRYSD